MRGALAMRETALSMLRSRTARKDTAMTDQPASQPNTWATTSGNAWVEMQDVLDRLFKPIETLLVADLPTGTHQRLLDVGCGFGATTLAAARRFGPRAQCTGVDISEAMIAAARARAEREGVPANFILADAQTHAFAPESFDTIISRFGVMFFADFVAAFTNLRRAAAEGATLRLLAWRSAAENPFMTTAESAAAPLLDTLPARKPDGPGQFAFADRARVQSILEASGWADIDISPTDIPCAMPESELVRYFTRLGPVGMALADKDEATRERVIAAVRPAFDPYVQGDEVRFTAACWLIAARA